MNRSKRGGASRRAGVVFPAAIFFLAVPSLFSQDFGFVLRQKALLKDGGHPYGAAEYTGTALPWFASPLGDRADLYLSFGISAEYLDEKWKPVPEMYRFVVTWNPRPGLSLELGRLPARGSSSVMAGLFDGASFRVNVGGGRLYGGVFYTGLLYKRSAYTVMTAEDRVKYDERDGYFASRRLAAEISWEHYGIFNTRSSFSASGAAQFDLNGTDALFHSQYVEANVHIPLSGKVNAGFGGVAELAEETGARPYAAFAISAEVQWLLPTALQDRLAFTGWFSSGNWNDRAGAFIPLTTRAKGKVLRPECSGIALLEAAYTARFHPKFSGDLSGAYYFRTDTVTFQHSGMDRFSASHLLGGEVYGGLGWTPFSDVLISAGGGVFFPRTGKAFAGDADLVYRVVLEASILF
ncbi:MAG: hypothetical protein LBI86_03835 [Treponema sp.]|nr:hypothetical protein [Treponema sp.]